MSVTQCLGCQAKARNKKHVKGSFQRVHPDHRDIITVDQVGMADIDGTVGIGGYTYGLDIVGEQFTNNSEHCNQHAHHDCGKQFAISGRDQHNHKPHDTNSHCGEVSYCHHLSASERKEGIAAGFGGLHATPEWVFR